MTILLTRPEGRPDDFVRRLESLGAHVIDEPVIRTVPLSAAGVAPLDRALDHLDRYDWLLFTSAEGVRYCLRRLSERGIGDDLAALLPETLRLAAIGPKTAAALRQAGRPPDLVAADHHAEGLVTALKSAGEAVGGRRFLLVRAERGRDVIPREIGAAGGEVEVVPAYRTEVIPEAAARAVARLARNEIDLVIATSGSALEGLDAALAAAPPARANVHVAALGPVTAARARELGFDVNLVAPSATLESLMEAIVECHGKET